MRLLNFDIEVLVNILTVTVCMVNMLSRIDYNTIIGPKCTCDKLESPKAVAFGRHKGKG